MGTIKKMSTHLANQIAAGEVVERPASIVKELVENSIDAHSTEITIELLESGIQQIKVTDNGQGMTREDLHLSIESHASSKIYSSQDLFRISSLGFRGEALASITSIAKVRIESGQHQTDDEHAGAFYIEVEASEIVNHGPTAALAGTRVTVDSIFYNTPARLKHLKSLRTELRNILLMIQDLSLAHPHIRLRLLNDRKEVFQSYGSGSLLQTIANVYHPNIARQLLALEDEDTDFKVSGFISPPQLTRANRYYIHWIINGRSVRSYFLNQALMDAYGQQLMVGRFPLSVINIELDPRLVDVNVHPTKQTVRIGKEAQLAELVITAIQATLKAHNPIPQVASPTQTPSQSLVAESTPQFSENEVASSTAFSLTDSPSSTDFQSSAKTISTEQLTMDEWESTSRTDETSTTTIDFSKIRYLGQIHGTYLIAEYPDGFYLIDQHAAQERINYERLVKNLPMAYNQQTLLTPLIIQLSPSDTQNFYLVQERLEALGLHLSEFGPQSFQLESYPAWIDFERLEAIIYDLIQRLMTQPQLSVAQIKEDELIMTACRGSIKANEYLEKSQAEALIMDLQTMDNPFHCPHGRPIFVNFDQQSLEKMFQRIPN